MHVQFCTSFVLHPLLSLEEHYTNLLTRGSDKIKRTHSKPQTVHTVGAREILHILLLFFLYYAPNTYSLDKPWRHFDGFCHDCALQETNISKVHNPSFILFCIIIMLAKNCILMLISLSCYYCQFKFPPPTQEFLDRSNGFYDYNVRI